MCYSLPSKDNSLFSSVLWRLINYIALATLHIKESTYMLCKYFCFTFCPHSWLFYIVWGCSVLDLRVHSFTSIHRCSHYTGNYDEGDKIKPSHIYIYILKIWFIWERKPKHILTIMPWVFIVRNLFVYCQIYRIYITDSLRKKVRKKSCFLIKYFSDPHFYLMVSKPVNLAFHVFVLLYLCWP